MNMDGVKYVINISPKKQHRYMGGTGHLILSPREIKHKNIKSILIMHNNYINEIREKVENKYELTSLGDINE